MNFVLEKLKLYIGAGLSSNYNQTKVDFTIGCWKVIDATHKSTGKRVSLWIIDHEFLEKRFPNKSDQQAYINGYITSIQNSRKLVHPHLLRIHEVQSDSYYFEFTSEHVTSCLKSHVGKLDSNDATYISFQIVDALSFLHNNTKKVHFGVSTSAVFLDDNYNAKLFNFNWLSPIQDDNTVKPPFSGYDTTPLYPNLKYTAPEVISSSECIAQTDIFSFGAVFCELLTGKQLLEYKTKEEYKVDENPINKIQGMTTNFYQMLSNCLNPNPMARPTSTELLREPAFNTVHMKILRYLDMILLKDPKDKFEFFKNFAKTIGGFSQNLLRCKIIPILVDECKHNLRFAPVLLPIVFQAGKYFSIDEFTEYVFSKVEFMIKVLDPPQILIAFLQSLDMILESTDKSIHDKRVYPIFYSALKSDQVMLQKEVLKRLPPALPKIGLDGIQKEVLPLLLHLCTKTDDAHIISSALDCVKSCLGRVDNDLFMKYLLPKIYDIWTKKQQGLLIPPISEILTSLKGNESSLLSYAIPIGAEIIANNVCHPYYQKQISSWMLASITKYKSVNKLDEVEDPIPQQEAQSSVAMELFDPLAEELNISPAQQTFDFTFSSGQLNSPGSQNSLQVNQSPSQPGMGFSTPPIQKAPALSSNQDGNFNAQEAFSPDFNSQPFNPNFSNGFSPNFSQPNTNPSSPLTSKDLRNLF